LFNHKFLESQVENAPRGLIFPFVVPIIADQTVISGDFSTEMGLGIYFISFIVLAITIFYVPFFKAIFFGFKSFRYGSICLISSTLFLGILLPYIVNSLFFDSFRFVFLIGGIFGCIILFTQFCTIKNLSKLGWTQINEEM